VRRVRMLGLCLAAALAIGAYAVSSASALPEWGKCEAQAGGKYSDSNCTVKAKKGSGAYEWHKGKTLKNVKFTGQNVGSGGVLQTELYFCLYHDEFGFEGPVGERLVSRKTCESHEGTVSGSEKISVECEKETNSGEISGAKDITNIEVKFSGCKLFGSYPCSNGPNEGEILVNPLKGEIGYINKSEKRVGVLLEPAKKHGEFAKFDCAGFLSTVVGVGNKKEGAFYEPENHGGYDGILSPITPVNTMTSKYEQVYTIEKEGINPFNAPSHFEGKHIDVLEDYVYEDENPEQSSMWSPAGEEITNVNTSTEEGEIKA
jgi:hypothetical protein